MSNMPFTVVRLTALVAAGRQAKERTHVPAIRKPAQIAQLRQAQFRRSPGTLYFFGETCNFIFCHRIALIYKPGDCSSL